MAKRFNPAPGWPAAPDGWMPPRGWKPDPSWPPAPNGWPVVVEEGPPRRWFRKARVLVPAALLLGVMIGSSGGGADGAKNDQPATLAAAATPTVTRTVTAAPKAPVTVTATSAPTTVTATTTVTAPGAPVTVTVTSPGAAGDSAGADDSAGSSAYYANCAEAKAAGVAPIKRGEPGYRAGLDRDDDGTACDK